MKWWDTSRCVAGSYSSTPTCVSLRSKTASAATARNADLDDERTAWVEMGSSVLEARDLGVLRRQVHDRVEDDVDEREASVDPRRCEVADRHRDLAAARLGAEFRDHVRREIDPVHGHTARREGQGDAAGANPELECRAITREVGQHVGGGGDDGGLELMPGGGV